MKKKIFVSIGVLALSLVTILSGCSEETESETGEVNIKQVEDEPQEKEETRRFGIGEEAPDFKLESIGGEVYRLEELTGKPILLNFFGVDCPYCREEMPELNRLYLENRDSAEVLLVDVGDEVSRVEDFIDELQLDVPVLHDEDVRVSIDYMVPAVPYTVIIDSKGVVSAVKVGPMSYEEMQTGLDLANNLDK